MHRQAGIAVLGTAALRQLGDALLERGDRLRGLGGRRGTLLGPGVALQFGEADGEFFNQLRAAFKAALKRGPST